MTDFSYDKSLHLKDLIPDSEIEDIEVWIKKYPGNRKRPPIMPTLKIVQEYNGNNLTTEMMQAVAEYLDVPHVAVYEVATFYSMFNLNKMGQHVLSVCTNISCSLRGSDIVVKHLEDRLNIKLGETTEDGLFSIKEVECMAACGGAPMLEVDKVYHENLTPEKIDKILSDIASSNLAPTNLSEPKATENIEAQVADTTSSDKSSKEKEVLQSESETKEKKKTQRKKKKEIKPEPILHLTPVNISVKKTSVKLEKELESIEKEISKEMQASAKIDSKKETTLKTETVKTKAVKKKIVHKKADKKKSQKDIVVEKQIEKPAKKDESIEKKDESEMSSLERAILRSSDNGE